MGINKYKRPGIYVEETDISYIMPEGGYFCSVCHKSSYVQRPVSEAHCISCGKDTKLITEQEVMIIQRNEKIDKLIE